MSDPVPNVPEPGSSVAAWSPPAALVALAWVAAAAALGWCVLVVGTGDDAGLLLAVVATAGLALGALAGTRARPRLRVEPSGLTVGGIGGARSYPWEQVDDVRVLAVRRLGRPSTLLEIDVTDPEGTERLLLFGRLDLGADPEDVVEVVQAARSGHRAT